MLQEKRRFRLRFDAEYFGTALTHILIALISVGLVFYFGYHMIRGFTPEVTLSTVYDISESLTCEVSGYVIRNERPVVSGEYGIADYAVADGARVAKNDRLCGIYAGGNEKTRKRIEELNGEIAVLRGAVSSGTVFRGMLEVSKDVSSGYSALLSDICAENWSAAAEKTGAFRQTLDRMRYLSGNAPALQQRLETLTAERDAAVASLGKAAGTVYAPEPGYFFYTCDGYEEIFSENLIRELTPESLERAAAAAPASTLGTVGKLTDGPKWYLAVVSDAEGLRVLGIGDDCRVVFPENGGAVLTMHVEKSSVYEDGRQLLLFSSDVMPDGFRYTRCQTVNVEYASFDGYRIPVKAVHSFEGMTGVYTLHGGCVYFRRINILGEVSGYYIVSGYEEIEPGKPETFSVPAYEEHAQRWDFREMEALAEQDGWTAAKRGRRTGEECYANVVKVLGRSAAGYGPTPLKYGESDVYYYYLNDLEQLIVTGRDLYPGKVLN